MRFLTILFALVIIALPLSENPAGAETRYVADQLVITMRQGRSSQHKILKTLKTGTPVEILEDNDDSYLKVRTTDGTEGYVLRQYISPDLPKALVVDELENKNNKLQQNVNELAKSKASLQNQLEEVQSKYVRESSELNKKLTFLEQNLEQAQENERIITEKYKTLVAESENIVQTTKERDTLRLENSKLQAGIKELQTKNKKNSDTRMIKWFLAGGGVFFFGWMIGKISRKKRSKY